MATTPQIEPVNLDCMSSDELHQVHVAYELLAQYARVKSNAMWNRERGNIRTAQAHEEHCQRIYNELPKWARW